QHPLNALQIPERSLVDRCFYAVPEPDIADPHESGKRSRQHHEIQRRQTRPQWHVPIQLTVPTEYPKPRCVWISRASGSSPIFFRSKRTNASRVFSSTSRRLHHTVSRISCRVTTRPLFRTSSSSSRNSVCER